MKLSEADSVMAGADDGVKRIRVVLDNGEEMKISDPLWVYDNVEDGIFTVRYRCTYYDATGEHTVEKTMSFYTDHVVYIQVDYKEESK